MRKIDTLTPYDFFIGFGPPPKKSFTPSEKLDLEIFIHLIQLSRIDLALNRHECQHESVDGKEGSIIIYYRINLATL